MSPDEKVFASISVQFTKHATVYVCDSETGHCISGPLESRNLGLSDLGSRLDACFSHDWKHILVKHWPRTALSCHAVVWDIGRGEEELQIEGLDFVFVHCGHNKGRIASIDWINEDGSSIRSVASQDQHSSCVLVKMWDIDNRTPDFLFEITDITVAQFSPNGQYLAVERQSENVVELWNLEDGKIAHRFSHSPGNLSSLYFSPTSDCLMAIFGGSDHKCLCGPDAQAMVSFDLDVGWIPPVVFHSPHTSRIFVARDKTVEIWEVSMSGSNMIFETGPLTTEVIRSICLSRDGLRLLVGSFDATVRMWNMEDLVGNQPVTQNTDVPTIIGFSPSGKMVATKSQRIAYAELRNTTTWDLVGPRDVEYEPEVAFSTDDSRIAVAALSRSLVTIHDVNRHLSFNHPSFNPWPRGRRVRNARVAFQTCNDLVVCSQLEGDVSHGISGLLQVWRLTDHIECTFSLDIDINTEKSWIFLAPDGLTLIIDEPISCYSWDYNTAQFDRVQFTDEAHIGGWVGAYSPDGELFACRSPKDRDVRVWDTRTGQLCGKPITMPDTNGIALSPALNDRFLGDRLIALHSCDTITLLDVHTGHLCARCWDSSWRMAFIQDGTKLVSYYPIRTHHIVDLADKHQNATHGYEPVPKYMKDGWMVGQDNETLFWVPREHREVLCLPHVEMIRDRPIKVDLSRFRYGSKWTGCIDREWLKNSTDLPQVQISATATSLSRSRTPEISQTQTQSQVDYYPLHVHQPHSYNPPTLAVTAPTAPHDDAPYHGYVQPPASIAAYPPQPGHHSAQSIPSLPVHPGQYIYLGYSPRVPISQTSSTSRASSPSSPPAIVPPMLTPGPSRAQTSAIMTSPSRTRSLSRTRSPSQTQSPFRTRSLSRTRSPGVPQTQLQVGHYSPHVHQPHLYYPPSPHGPSTP